MQKDKQKPSPHQETCNSEPAHLHDLSRQLAFRVAFSIAPLGGGALVHPLHSSGEIEAGFEKDNIYETNYSIRICRSVANDICVQPINTRSTARWRGCALAATGANNASACCTHNPR